MPSELPDETFSFATKTLFGSRPELGAIPSEMFLKEREQVLTAEELQEIPGFSEILEKYMEFHRDIKKFLRAQLEKGSFKGKKLAEDQPQLFTFDDRMEPRRVRDFVLRFYDGDLTGTFQQALRYYYSNKLESDLDKAFAEELIKMVEYKPAGDNRRKGSERESKKKKEEEERKKQEIEEKTKKLNKEAEEVLKTKTELEKAEAEVEEIKKKEAELKRALRKSKRELSGETAEAEAILAKYKYKDETGKTVTETIKIDFAEKIATALEFYKNHKIEIPVDFAEVMQDVWDRNRRAIQEQIEEFGFDEILIIPANIKIDDAFDKEMTGGYKKKDGTPGEPTYWGVNMMDIVSDKRTTENRIILVHKNKARDLMDDTDILPILKETLNKKGGDFKPEEGLTLEEYYIFQRVYFEETGENLDSGKGVTWLPGSRDGSLVVRACFRPGDGQVCVYASSPGYSSPVFGCRLSRCFK